MTQIHEIAKVCDGLAHPIRVRIYEILLEKQGEWVKVSDLFKIISKEFGISSRQTLSNHLKTMVLAGIIEMEKRGKDYYVQLKMKVDVKTKPLEVVV